MATKTITLRTSTPVSSQNVEKGICLTVDTLRTGIHYSLLSDCERFLIGKCLQELGTQENDRVRIRLGHRRPAQGIKTNIVYARTVRIYPKTCVGEKVPYIHISFYKHYKFSKAYDVKFCFHASRMDSLEDYINLLDMADPSGILKHIYVNSEICWMDVKQDFRSWYLNFLLKHLDCTIARKPHIKVNKEKGFRSFYINNCIYFYEKKRADFSFMRLEYKLKTASKVQKYFPGITIHTLAEGKLQVPKELFKGWNLIFHQGNIPITTREIRVDDRVRKTLKSIMMSGTSANTSLLETKTEINRSKKDKGKFGSVAKKLYKRQNFYEVLLQQEIL